MDRRRSFYLASSQDALTYRLKMRARSISPTSPLSRQRTTTSGSKIDCRPAAASSFAV